MVIGSLNVGALALLGYGIICLLAPLPMARFLAQVFNSPRGMAEFRIVNGGYFTGLALFALVTADPMVYTAIGVGWLGAAAGRVYAFIVDRPKLDTVYVGLLVFELLMAASLLLV